MATQEDRSLGSGMSIPQWMKNKMNNKLDFDQTAFSPTELDDSYLLAYRYPKPANQTQEIITITGASGQSSVRQPDLSRHPASCQKYLMDGSGCATAQHVVNPSATSAKVKSSGIDDGFKGEAAKCGSSIIKVANQMVSGKIIRGFDTSDDQGEKSSTVPEGFNPALRRGSKSLPASPLSSPKSNRRVNKYFTGPFVDSEKGQSWILSNLLAKRERNIMQSVESITEEDLKGSKDNLAQLKTRKDDKNKGFVPKSSELREMNFWCPTST